MKPAPFKYAVAESIEEASALLVEHGDDAKILAGGQSLIPLLSMRLARPSVLVDVNRIPALQQVAADGVLRIGATARQARVMRAPEVAAHAPIVREALRHVGHVGIRSRGTVGGAAAHADPASEIPLVLLALDAELVVHGPAGERIVPAEDFFVSVFTTDLAEDELVTEVRVPQLPGPTVWSFHELARRHGDFALVGVAVVASLDGTGSVARARVALSGVSDTPLRLPDAEQALLGRQPGAAAADAGRVAEEQVDPPADFHASADYRRQVARVLVTRAVEEIGSKGGS